MIIDYREKLYSSLLNYLNTDPVRTPHYWTGLFNLCFLLFDNNVIVELKERIAKLELTLNMNLFELETYLQATNDYNAFFKGDDGTKITVFDIDKQLYEIKLFVLSHLKPVQSQIRFSQSNEIKVI